MRDEAIEEQWTSIVASSPRVQGRNIRQSDLIIISKPQPAGKTDKIDNIVGMLMEYEKMMIDL